MDLSEKYNLEIAVIVPCYNEGMAIEKVVTDFKTYLPSAQVYVFDNNSSDDTISKALKAGAHVYSVIHKGKGNVVRRMFADVDADIYVMVDGDATYDAESSPKLIQKLIDEHLDMVVGTRVHSQKEAYRAGHTFGNKMLTGCVKSIFGGKFSDMLSGYRIFTKRYVKSFPAMAKGFETETELTVHALELRMPYGEMATPYYKRMEGDSSKLSTYKDGIKILKTIIKLYAFERPILFYGLIALILFILGLAISLPILDFYLETGLVPRLPTALLSTGLVLLSSVLLITGLINENVATGRRELKRLSYLSFSNKISLKNEK